MSLKHKYWSNPFLYVSFPCSSSPWPKYSLKSGILLCDLISINLLPWFHTKSIFTHLTQQNWLSLWILISHFSKKKTKKKLGQLCCIYGQLSEFERVKIKLPSILGAISLPIWSLACHHRMFVHPPIPTHMHQNVRIDCSNNFVSRVKICECFSQNESSKLNQWIQWFYKNIWLKKKEQNSKSKSSGIKKNKYKIK